jgi:hypothetical protein
VVEECVPSWRFLYTSGGGVNGSFFLTVCNVANPVQVTGGQLISKHLEDVGW